MARPDSFQTIYLDSAAFLKVIMNESGHEPITRVLELADQGKVEIIASPLILVEVRGQGKGRSDPDADERALAVLSGARITNVELSHGVAMTAREYVGTHKLDPADAIHLASAVEAEVDLFWSPDDDFDQLWGSRFEGVWVDKPYRLDPPHLFDHE